MNNSEGTIGLEHPKVMGDFKGHALPGTFFIIVAFWWSTKSILKYVFKKQKRTYYLGFKALFHRAEILEGIVIVGMVLTGIIGSEVVFLKLHLTSHKETQWIENLHWHHFTVYVFFGLLGVTKILCFTIHSLPNSLTQLMLSNALFVEALIFFNHTHGREMLDIFGHHLLSFVNFLAGLVAFLEFLIRNNVLLELLRSSLVMLQGSWFWQMGFVLFPIGGPTWDLRDHNNKMFLTTCLCWHYALTYIIIGMNYTFITGLVKWRLRRLCPSEVGLLKNAEGGNESEEEL